MPVPQRASSFSTGATWPTTSTIATATGALLLVNAAAWAILWRRHKRQIAATSNRCCCGQCRNSTSSASAPSSESTAPVITLDPHQSRPTGEVFAAEFTAFPACEPPLRRQVRRQVQCRDTIEFLQGVAPATALSTVRAGNDAAASTSPCTSAVASDSVIAAASVDDNVWDPTRSWSGCSVITSVPDVSETGLPLNAWRTWFRRACTLIFERVDPDQVVLLYQTDVIVEGGRWESKSALCMQAAASVPGMRLVWHKIVVLRSPRTVRGSTAGYTHLMCFSREHKQSPGVRTPDVLANRGPMLWARAMGLRACEVAVDYVRTQLRSSSSSSSSSASSSSSSSGGCHTVIDPFCGSGSVLAMANARGLHSFGVDHSRSRARQAAELQPQRVMDELAQDAQAHEVAHNDLFGEGSGAAVETNPSASPSASPSPSPAAASGGAAAASGPFRTAEEIARRTARKERKEARKALGLTQKQQQQEDKRQAQLKQQQQQQQPQQQQSDANAVVAPADS